MWSKRGRPKSTNTDFDKGTIELQKKRTNNLTTESLDLCLQRNIITPVEHIGGIKLRWMYTLKFGIPTIQSKLLQMKFYDSKNYDEKFLASLQKQYCDIIEALKAIHAHKIVMSICIFNEFPSFLKSKQLCDYQKEKFTQGVKLLVKRLRYYILFH